MAAIIGPLYLVWAFVPDSVLVGSLALEITFWSIIVIFWPLPTPAQQVGHFLARETWAKPAWAAVVRRKVLVLDEHITPAYGLCQGALEALSGEIEILRQHPGRGEIVALKTYSDGVSQDLITIDAKLESSTRTRVENDQPSMVPIGTGGTCRK